MLLNFLLNFLFPKICYGCGEWGEYLCPDCLNKIKVNPQRICPVCGRPAIDGKTHPFCLKKYSPNGLTSVFIYSGLTQKIIKKMKYRFVFAVYKILVKLFLTNLGEEAIFPWVVAKKPIFVPVPLHPNRERWRGFNQAELLGRPIAKNLGLRFCPKLLVRVKNTKTQSLLSKKERAKNIKGAFCVNPKYLKLLKSLKILLFDDVWTTGATMRECALVLKKAGARSVWGITLASV